MQTKLVVIISSGEAAKARTGVMYAVNALKYGWMEDVKIFVFGPAQDLLLTDEGLRELIDEYRSHDQEAVACKFLADRDRNSDRIRETGVRVEYIGEMISNLIRDGYVPLVW